jgi:major membrane immunogen (membrane-anchored lipoprotein)
MPGSAFADPDGQFPDLGGSLYVDPALVNPGSNNSYSVTVNAGAIASQDEFAALLQQTIQQLNRNGDPLTTAGIS